LKSALKKNQGVAHSNIKNEDTMNKYFYILSIVVLAVSCGKEVGIFKPTTKLENILKNEKLGKVYYEFRKKNIYLTLGIDTVKSFEKFVAETSIKELISLTECERPVVRCFAFKALVEKDYPEIRKILFRHKYDEENVEEFHGNCIRMNIPVKIYMLNELRPFASYKNEEFLKLEKDFMQN
jgi:peroxiredoxin family protein